MKGLFEVMAQDVLPTVRAMIAKRLLDNGFPQQEIANKLGLTQPAVSQYKKGVRGMKTDIITKPKIVEVVNSLAKSIGAGEISFDQATSDIFDVCRELFQKGEFAED